ncbi:pyridoxamine 5'-phosphate oxidase family protein [Chengkuizengella axinellae]|uniref:Pyridoxamine 5'-phosphate oxidase family protein n=1 Tax=Chengkuizengella axinellae TaxID=3064388 RepID=A0ABT9IUT8_9BACL|nr:pyridoxamine 5'-phosphate oxidase family protein [Chengkuizengella sp. 2205SS18-9]MDP5273130.1 pyridoxamine 5'-phosphate oxidase family protein [Chengkuizengella sp. 2205SS18-9]
MTDILTELNEPILSQLQKEKLVLLHTVDEEIGSPTSNVISWVHAVNAKTVRFAVDQRSRIVKNIKLNKHVALTTFASSTVYEIAGSAEIVTEAMDDVPFKLACIEIKVEGIRDVMFYGARISNEPEYEKTYDKRAAEKLDGQVFDAIKKC